VYNKINRFVLQVLKKLQSFTRTLYNHIKLIITFVHTYFRKGLRSIFAASLFTLFTLIFLCGKIDVKDFGKTKLYKVLFI